MVCAAVFFIPCFSSTSYNRQIIIIPENASLRQLGDSLSKYYDKTYSDRVLSIARLMGPMFKLRKGAYELKSGQSPFQAAKKIGRGSRYIVTISLNNIRTPQQLAKKVSDKLSFTEDKLMSALKNDSIVRTYGLSPDNIMALFLADNYEVYWECSPQEFIKKTGANYQRFWNGQRRRKASQLGLTPLQVQIIASIADEESNKADEKARICRLYYNRLKKNMRLQADPTVKYAIGDFSIKRITRDHLAEKSPYNTYRNNGLPPGPIRISDKTTIDAFLNSSPTEDIYMCAKEDFSGYHNFTSSYQEHLANAARYQEKLNSIGIK